MKSAARSPSTVVGPAPAGAPSPRAGFTLLELLAAIAILLVIVWIMARIFSESDRAWNFGSSQAETSIEARAALQMINHDMQYAIVDNNLTFAVRPASARALEVSVASSIITNIYGSAVHELCFVSLQHDSTGDAKRAVREVHYYIRAMTNGIERYELVRGYWSKTIETDPNNHCYHNPDWYRSGGGHPGRPTSSQVIAENVCNFRADVNYVVLGSNLVERTATTYLSSGNNFRLPESVDITISVLSERDVLQLLQMKSNPLVSQARINEFIERNARRFSTRVYFQNRLGYRNRGGVW